MVLPFGAGLGVPVGCPCVFSGEDPTFERDALSRRQLHDLEGLRSMPDVPVRDGPDWRRASQPRGLTDGNRIFDTLRQNWVRIQHGLSPPIAQGSGLCPVDRPTVHDPILFLS